MIARLSSFLLLTSLLPCVINAWMNPQFKNSLMRSIPLRMKGDKGDDIDSYRLRLENMFEGQEDILDNDWSSLDLAPIVSSLEITSDSYDGWLESTTSIPCRGEDCEQCEIPDDLKQQALSVDVLEFLGIQRAQPLRTPRIEE